MRALISDKHCRDRVVRYIILYIYLIYKLYSSDLSRRANSEIGKCSCTSDDWCSMYWERLWREWMKQVSIRTHLLFTILLHLLSIAIRWVSKLVETRNRRSGWWQLVDPFSSSPLRGDSSWFSLKGREGYHLVLPWILPGIHIDNGFWYRGYV